MKASKLFKEFTQSEKSGGIVLLCCTILSLILANSPLGVGYVEFWNSPLFGHTVSHWINDGLMTIFFLLVGLELEREIYVGELSKLRNAMLPIVAALGGMLVPAMLYSAVNHGTPTQSGAGIPMATDIAFALGILSLLGNKVPLSLKIFLTALAVIDDLGAILVIAFFYTNTMVWSNLAIALALFGIMLVFNRLKILSLWIYLPAGFLMWWFMLHSGVHATISGVLLAFAIPFGKGNAHSPSHRLQHALHKPVAYLVLPLFALANTAIVLGWSVVDSFTQLFGIGIVLGLVLGKPLGIALFSYLAWRFGICSLPSDLNWKKIIATGFLGGIGFTMSIFITLLAFTDAQFIDGAKFIIIISSCVAGLIGMLFLKRVLK